MTGKEIFDKYAFASDNEKDEAYGQTLLTIYMLEGEKETYRLIEQAEKEGKRLDIVEADTDRMDGDIVVIMV